MRIAAVLVVLWAVAACRGAPHDELYLLRRCAGDPPVWTDGHGHLWQGYASGRFGDLDPIAPGIPIEDICK